MNTRRYNGAVRNLDELQGRCYVDAATGCWHMRDSRGRPLEHRPKAVPRIFVHLLQRRVNARRIAWQCANPKQELQPGQLVAYTCGSWDCVNPKHCKPVLPAELGQMVSQDGRAKTPAKVLQAMKAARARRGTKLTPELAQWARESPQKQVDIGHALGLGQNRVSDIVRGKLWRDPVIAGASVFALGVRG